MHQLTTSACRYHRRALGLTQTGLAKAAGSSPSYVKMFESERLKPSQDFVDKLCAYFTSQGVPPEKLAIEYAVSPEKAAPAVIQGPIEGMATLPQVNMGGRVEERQCFFIARGLPVNLVEDFLARLDANDDRLTVMFAKATQEPDVFDRTESGFSVETDADLREVFGLLAESFVLFRLLIGWPLLEGEAVRADTVAGVILSHYDDLIKAKRAPDGDEIEAEQAGEVVE